MNGIEKITARIGEDVQKEIDAIQTKASAEASAITERYEQLAKKESEEILDRGRKAAEERVERLGSVAKLEAKKATLATKQDVVNMAFDLALEQLASLPEADYITLLAKLAVAAAKSGREQVALSQKDRTRFGKQVVTEANALLGIKGALTLSDQVRPMKGGLVLLGDRVEVNCSFETLVRLQRETLAAEVAQILFQETV